VTAVHPPFMNATGLITKIFGRIAEAQKPERFTTDYLTTVIGYGSGSARPIIPLLKRLGFLQSDGTPTPLYSRYRNPSERASAVLEALKAGYPTLYARSEYAHVLNKDKLRDLVVEVTGLVRDSSTVDAIVGTFQALKALGNIDATTTTSGPEQTSTSPTPVQVERSSFEPRHNGEEVGMNLSYTINLNLPASPDPEVFNAIFKALREHLLRK
jgi:Family of unknown function (DUF5343)